jgi:cyanophycin synthetase
MKLHLGELDGRESNSIPDFNDRLRALLPGLEAHQCSRGRAGGFIERLIEGTYFGHVVEHVALELTELAGIPVTHGKTRAAGEPGCYHVIIEYKAEEGTKHLLRTAVELVETVVRGDEFPLEERIKVAKRIVAQTELGPSTKAIVEAAERRGIPWRRVGGESLVQLGYGKHRKMVKAAMSSQTSAIAVDLASDKEMTKVLLREAGIPVPRGVIVSSEEEAVWALREVGAPVAVKPFDGCQGKGISLNLTSAQQVVAAFQIAHQCSPKVIVEEQLTGRDYRVLVVNGEMVAASERIPAHIVGDGTHTIAELIEIVNEDPHRGDGHEKSLTRLILDQSMTAFLQKRGLTPKYRPPANEIVYLRECANLSTGGTARDVTAEVHPQVRAMCERAARVIGLDICGIDLILHDISEPVHHSDGIVEVNAAPGLRMHLTPSEGAARDVGGAIVEMLFPSEAESPNGRIPLISITGTNGKTTITRMIGHVFASIGQVVGMTTTDGINIGGQMAAKGDTTGPWSARVVLSDPSVEVAVLETARGGITRSGLGYDWSDISVISNIRLDHIGQDGIEDLDDLLFVKSLVAERVREGGTLVLNADDERLAQLMDDERVNRLPKEIVFFSMHPLHVTIRRHLDAGGVAFLCKKGWIVEVRDGVEQRIIRAADIPATLGGNASFNVANALAAVAACRAHGLLPEIIAEALKSFHGGEQNPGRAGLYEAAGGYVLVDYGHNPDAFEAVCRMTSKWSGRRVTGIIGVPGDRDDAVIATAGRSAARGFHRLFIKEDRDLRGRRVGEVAEILCRAAREEVPSREYRIIYDEAEALREALREMSPGEMVVIFYEKLEPILGVLHEFEAAPAPALSDESFSGNSRRLSHGNG